MLPSTLSEVISACKSTLDYVECTKVDGMAKKAFVVNVRPPLIVAAALYDFVLVCMSATLI